MSIKQLTAKELQADSIRMARANRDKRNADDVKFFNVDGFCSSYAHSCGYMDSLYHGDYKLTMELDGLYQIKLYHANNPRVLWNSYETRVEAKWFFKFMRKLILNGASLEVLQRQEQR